jgi:hypothetical protein
MKIQPMRLGKLNLAPDDILVFSAPRMISLETAERIKKQAKAFAPKNKIIVLGDGLKVGKITKAKKKN